MYVTTEKIVNGGQTLATLEDGRKVFIWGGLLGETVKIRVVKKKSKYSEALVEEVGTPSQDRTEPKDPDSYLSTSPWQIMSFEAEQGYKKQLIREAFELHKITLPDNLGMSTDGETYGYRNKLEFSWYSELDKGTDTDSLDLAFYKRGSRAKIVVDGSSLASESINRLAIAIRDLLHTKHVSARSLKTLLIRSNQAGSCVWQLYVKDTAISKSISSDEASLLPAQGGEIIYSNPKSPASVITERLAKFGDTALTDKILGIPFQYAAESFFQINIPVYEQALRDMSKWVTSHQNSSLPEAIVDLYSGVGTIGLTIGGKNPTLVEINEHAVREMERNIQKLGLVATPVLSSSEAALEHIVSDKIVIIDPPRAGLHADVVARLLDQQPPRVVYLSCNPVTQARDVQLLLEKYRIVHVQGYNFFPRTPHIENLVVLDRL